MESAILKMLCFKASLRSVSPPHFRLRCTMRRPVILVSLDVGPSALASRRLFIVQTPHQDLLVYFPVMSHRLVEGSWRGQGMSLVG